MAKKDEKIDAVNSNDVTIGETDVHTAHTKPVLHRVVGILLMAHDNLIVVQSGNKFWKYDISAGGHVGFGEDPNDAASRELKEELGVVTSLKKIVSFLPKETRHGHFWHVFEGKAPEDWEFKPTDEVSSIVFMSLEEIVKGMNQNPKEWTFGFRNVMHGYLKAKNIDLVLRKYPHSI